jgi:hypothetical protein
LAYEGQNQNSVDEKFENFGDEATNEKAIQSSTERDVEIGGNGQTQESDKIGRESNKIAILILT